MFVRVCRNMAKVVAQTVQLDAGDEFSRLQGFFLSEKQRLTTGQATADLLQIAYNKIGPTRCGSRARWCKQIGIAGRSSKLQSAALGRRLAYCMSIAIGRTRRRCPSDPHCQ